MRRLLPHPWITLTLLLVWFALNNTVAPAHTVLGSVESVKAVSDIFIPVGGEVIEINKDVVEHPEKVNQDPHGAAWLIKVRLDDPADLKDLMNAADYQKLVASGGH